MKVTKIILTVIMIFITLSLVGCDEKLSNKERAEIFVRKALTVPQEDISEVVNSGLDEKDIEQYAKKLDEAIESFCGDFVSKDAMTNPNSTFYQRIIMLHIMASGKDYTYTVESVEVTKKNDKKYNYTADILASNEENKLSLYGTIQFNDDNKIDYMSLHLN